ncbi:MAG: hypothetical protein OHK0022_08640 [Roseiflexaceae bacterium]
MMQEPDSMDTLLKRIANLPPEKRALLEARLQKTGAARPTGITASPAGEPAPLSFAQERLWFLDQFDPASPAYNRLLALRIGGPLRGDLLERSVQTLVSRHDVLRSTFVMRDGQLWQQSTPHTGIALPIEDLCGLPAGEREQAAHRRAVVWGRQPFDLANGPVFRALLLRLDADDHLLLLSMHHIVADGWSDGVIQRELGLHYRALAGEAASAPPELAIQYRDYARWQRVSLTDEVLATQLAYWREQLRGPLPVIQLPFDRPRPALPSTSGASEPIALPAPLTSRLRQHSQSADSTVFMTLLAGLCALLYRSSGQEDLLIGAPVAGRTRSETELLIGCFVNTLALRVDVRGNPTFRELLGRIRSMTLQAYAHQDVPVERVLEDLHPDRDLARAPIIQVALALQNTPAAQADLPGLTLRPVRLDLGVAKTDLTIYLWDDGEQLSGLVEYNTDLFYATTIRRLIVQLLGLLDQAIAQPDRPIATLSHALNPVDHIREDFEALYRRSNLTRNQLLIWIGQQIYPDVPLYNIPIVFHLFTEISLGPFQRAFQTLINSSDALRTVIREEDGVPHQEVLPALDYQVRALDLSTQPDPESALADLVAEYAAAPFRLDSPLFDAALIRMGNQHTAWLLKYHHIISDGWSAYVIFKRMDELYGLALANQLPATVALPHYAEHLALQRAYQQSERYRKVAAYWNAQQIEPQEPITFYNRQVHKQHTNVERVRCELGPERSRSLKQLAARVATGATSSNAALFSLFATLLCAYLYRISGRHELVLGTPFHNRGSRQAKETIGLYMEVLPIRIKVADSDSFLSLLHTVQAQFSRTLRYTNYTMASPVHRQSYDTFINYQPFGEALFHGAPIAVDWLHPGHEQDSLALQIHDFAHSGDLVLNFDFHCDVFTPDQQQQAVTHMLQLVDAAITAPDQRITDARLLDQAEQQWVLHAAQPTATLPLAQRSVVELFADQVQRAPEQIALVVQDQSLTYAQLSQRASQIGYALAGLGLRSGQRVGICLERSPDLVASVLAVLAIGCAYVPLEPTLGPERLTFMARDAGIATVITQRSLPLEWLPKGLERLDLDAGGVDHLPCLPLARPKDLDLLAYIIYTSGSTGTPKGVAVSHRALANMTAAWTTTYDLRADDRHLQMAGFSFDVFAGDLVRALCSGARLVLCPRELLLAPQQLAGLIQHERITCAEFVPAVLRGMLAYLKETGQPLEGMRTLIVGSDSWYAAEHAALRRVCGPGTRLINSYGVTEATIDSACFDGVLDNAQDDRLVPIGRPLPHVAIYLLDRHMQPVAVGVQGEIYIGGLCLAQGYLNQPALTAERFVPNPFVGRLDARDLRLDEDLQASSLKPQASRLYKTGDLARWLPDGTIEFLGRNDTQVKLRGFRIELGEIEAVLVQHPVVRQSVVLARAMGVGGQQLVAYVVTAEPQQPQAEQIAELRAYLAARLPDYMVPALFVLLDRLPLTPNGKLDRRALPEPDRSQLAATVAYVPPQTDLERAIAGVWQEVLQVPAVGIHHNFFDLGGHSLLLVRVNARLREVLDRPISMITLFQYPTVSALARYLRQGDDAASEDQTALRQKLSDGAQRLQQRRNRHNG